MKATKDKFPFLNLREPWVGNKSNIWLASTLHLYRNLSRFQFPQKLDVDTAQQVRSLVEAQLCASPELDRPYAIQAEAIGPLEKEFLFEHFLSQRSFQQTGRGEGFVVDQTGSTFATINLRDHLELQVTDCNETLEESHSRLVLLETEIAKQLEFAYSPKFGYLPSDPVHCGTGLLVRTFLHLPALLHTDSLNEALTHLNMEAVEALSIQGGIEEVVGDVIILSNRSTVGLTEETILQAVRANALKLIVAEKRARAELRETANPDMIDKVSRAFGLAIHSYQLETVEAWGALSLLKLGLDIGWVGDVTHKLLNELLFDCRRAHLVCEFSEEISQEELAHRRADYIHASLSKTHLNI